MLNFLNYSFLNVYKKPLLDEHNVASVIMENPFYAGRKPERQIYSGLRKFIDVLSLSMGVALESNAVRKWLIDNYDVTNIVRVGNLKLKKIVQNNFSIQKRIYWYITRWSHGSNMCVRMSIRCALHSCILLEHFRWCLVTRSTFKSN